MNRTLKSLVIGMSLALCAPGVHAQVTNGKATSAAPSYANNSSAPLSMDLAGNLRTGIAAIDDFYNQGSTTAGQMGPLMQGSVTASAPTYVTLTTNPLSITTSGQLRTLGAGVGNATPPVIADAQQAALSLTGNSGLRTQSVFGSASAVSNNGVSGTGVQRVTIASDSTGVVGLNAGTNNIGDVDVATVISVISATNSTTSALGIGAVFTGTSESTLGYGSITVSVNTLQVSATDGLSVQQSLDNGVTWPILDTYTLAAGSKTVTVPAQGNALRVVYTNGGVATGTPFQISTRLNPQRARDVSVRADATTSIQNDFDETVAALYAYDGTALARLEGNATTGLEVNVTTLPTLANVTTVGTVTTVTGATVIPATTTAGTSNFSLISLNTTNTNAIKAGAGTVYEISMYNNSATLAYLKLYNATSATCGSGTPVARYLIPASSSGAGSNVVIPLGKSFATGISMCLTTGIADADTGAVAANAYLINVTYK